MSLAVIEPKAEYDRKNEAEWREQVRSSIKSGYNRGSNLLVPFGKKLQFTSAQGQVITFGYNTDGNFTIGVNNATPFGLASLSTVLTIQSDLESSLASLETSLTAEFGDLEASFSTLSTAFADLETSFAALYVDVEAANEAAAAAASSALEAASSETAAGSYASAAAGSATSASTSAGAASTSAGAAATSASNASTSASQASTSETNAAGSASTAATQATNASNSATSAGNSASAASTSASNAATSATNAGNSASSASTSASNAATSATNASNSASAASTSASTASTQATNAGNSASAAQTAQVAAESARDDAEDAEAGAATSASAAAGSASSAATSATAAGSSATAASGSATTASTQASNAATSASNAATSATQASTSETNAAGSASTASTQATVSSASAAASRASAGQTFPSVFEEGYWTSAEGTRDNPTAFDSGWFATVSGHKVYQTRADETGVIAPIGSFVPVPGRTYKAVWEVRRTQASTDGRTSKHYPYFYVYYADTSQNWLADSATIDGASSALAPVESAFPLSTWVTYECTWQCPTSGTEIVWSRPRWHWNWDDVGGPYADAEYEFRAFRLVDVTEQLASAASAAASAGSASTASTQAGLAGASASAALAAQTAAEVAEDNAASSASTASTQASNASSSASSASSSAGTAATHASNAASSASAAAGSASSASSSASTATTQASNASASASSAASSATLSATYAAGSQGGSLNKNPVFTAYTNSTGVPDEWVDWYNGSSFTRQTGEQSAYGADVVLGSDVNCGFQQANLVYATGWYVLEFDAWVQSGHWGGAGSYLTGASEADYLSCSTDPDTNNYIGVSSLGVRRFRKLIQVTASEAKTLYAMANWDGHTNHSAKTIRIYRCAVRPASQGEIEARQATLDLVTANANIATNAAASATNAASIASLSTTVSSNHAAVMTPSVNLIPYPSGTARNNPYGEGLSTTAQGWVVNGGSAGAGFVNGYWDPAGGAILYNSWASGYSSGSDRFYYLDIPISIGGAPYTFSFNGYVSNLDDTKAGLYIESFNGSTWLNASSWVTFASQGGNAITSRRSVTLTAGSGATKIRIVCKIEAQTSPSAGTYADLVFRALQLEYGSTATKFNEATRLVEGERRIGTAEAAITSEASTRASADSAEASTRAAADATLTTNLGTTNANVATNSSAIATINGAAAFWETIVSASGGDLAAVRLKAGASGSYLELISTVLRLANASNGSVIEVMRAISGEAYFSRPISSDSGSRRVTIGPGYGVSGSEVVLWFGPVATAPASQSRTNGYFALGTDGVVYYGAGALSTVTAYYGTHNGPAVASRTGAGYVTSGNVTITPVNGTAPFYYRYTMLENPNSIALNAVDGSGNNTFSINATITGGATWRCNVQVDITDAIGRTTRVIVSDNELYDDT